MGGWRWGGWHHPHQECFAWAWAFLCLEFSLWGNALLVVARQTEQTCCYSGCLWPLKHLLELNALYVLVPGLAWALYTFVVVPVFFPAPVKVTVNAPLLFMAACQTIEPFSSRASGHHLPTRICAVPSGSSMLHRMIIPSPSHKHLCSLLALQDVTSFGL